MVAIDKGCLAIIIIPILSTSIGFIDFLYFVSIGYAISMALNGLSLIIIYFDSLNTVSLTICLFFIIYGIRLFSYLIIRKCCVKSFIQRVGKDIKKYCQFSIFCMYCLLDILCSIIYFINYSRILYYSKQS